MLVCLLLYRKSSSKMSANANDTRKACAFGVTKNQPNIFTASAFIKSQKELFPDLSRYERGQSTDTLSVADAWYNFKERNNPDLMFNFRGHMTKATKDERMSWLIEAVSKTESPTEPKKKKTIKQVITKLLQRFRRGNRVNSV